MADHTAVNKMEMRNLAIVLGPTLVRITDDNMVSMVTDMSQQCWIIESILSYCLWGGSSQAAYPRETISAYRGGHVLEVTPVGRCLRPG